MNLLIYYLGRRQQNPDRRGLPELYPMPFTVRSVSVKNMDEVLAVENFLPLNYKKFWKSQLSFAQSHYGTKVQLPESIMERVRRSYDVS